MKLYKTITIRKLQKEEDDARVRWWSEPRGGGRTDGDSLVGALQYAMADAEEAREKRRREARE